MEPLTIALLAGGAILVFLGLKKSSAASQSQAQVTQGAEVVQAGGTAFQGPANQIRTANENLNSVEFKGVAGAAGAGTTAGVAAAGTSGAATGALTAGITFGVGAVVALAAVLWAKHEARIKGAKTENAATNLIVPGWIETIQGIISAYNNGTINDVQTVAELKSLKQLVWDSWQRYNHTPGVDWAGGGTQPGLSSQQKFWTVKCDKHCTIGCCLFNNIIGPATNNAIALVSHQPMFNVGGKAGQSPWSGQFTVPVMSPSPQYGFKGAPSFVLSVTK